MCFRRVQNGTKRQPSYIVVFKENGIIKNMAKAKKASEQWGDLPIVIVDKGKCLENQKEQLNSLMEEYKNNPSLELEKEIRQKIKNNQNTSKEFASDLDIDNILNRTEEIAPDLDNDNILNKSKEQSHLNNNVETNSKEKNDICVDIRDFEENYKSTTSEERKKEIKNFRENYRKLETVLKMAGERGG